MSYKVSQVQDGSGNASLDILDEHRALIVRFVYDDRNEALRARGLLEDAISRVMQISTV